MGFVSAGCWARFWAQEGFARNRTQAIQANTGLLTPRVAEELLLRGARGFLPGLFNSIGCLSLELRFPSRVVFAAYVIVGDCELVVARGVIRLQLNGRF